MNSLIVNGIKTDYELYLYKQGSLKGTISQNSIGIEFKDNIVYLLKYFLSKHNFNINKINLIGAITGPGSYSGLRVSLSLANALAMSLDIPIIGVSLFDILVSIIKRDNILKDNYNDILILVPNYKGGVFGQWFDNKLISKSEPMDLDYNNLQHFLDKHNIKLLITVKEHFSENLKNDFNKLPLIRFDINSEAINFSVLKKYESKNFNKKFYPLSALYIKPPKITISKKLKKYVN